MLRQSVHKVNTMHNDELILRRTITDHASLLLLRKVGTQPDANLASSHKITMQLHT